MSYRQQNAGVLLVWKFSPTFDLVSTLSAPVTRAQNVSTIYQSVAWGSAADVLYASTSTDSAVSVLSTAGAIVSRIEPSPFAVGVPAYQQYDAYMDSLVVTSTVMYPLRTGQQQLAFRLTRSVSC